MSQIENTIAQALFSRLVSPPTPQQQQAPAIGGYYPQQQQEPPREQTPDTPEVEEAAVQISVDMGELDRAIDEVQTRIMREMGSGYTPPTPVVDGGGPLDSVLGWVNSQIGGVRDSAASSLGVATSSGLSAVRRAVNSLTTQLGKVASQSNTNNNILRGHASSIRANSRRTARLESEFDARFGPEGRVYRAALQVLGAMPGLRSMDVLNGDAFKAILSGLAEFGDEIGDMTDYSQHVAAYAEDLPNAYSADPTSDLGDVIDEIHAQHIALVGHVNSEIAQIRAALTALVEHDIKANANTVKTQTTDDTFTLLSKIAPSQIADQSEAMMEAAGRLVFGRAPGSTLTLAGLL